MAAMGLGMSLMHLDLESYDQKIWRFSTERPYTYRTKPIRVRNATTFSIQDIQISNDGNIEQMPELIGKPCFGIITAYLRHGAPEAWSQKIKRLVPSRCGRCEVRDACISVCNVRILAVPAIATAVVEWNRKGGRSIFATPKSLHASRGSWTKVVQVARTAGFTNSNDSEVIAHWDREQQKLHVEEEKARRRALRKSRAAGVLDDGLVALVMAERDKRAMYLKLERMAPNPPHWIAKLDDRSANMIASAWAARFLLRFQPRKITPGMVATRMLKDQMVSGITQPSLRQRLPNDFRRIAMLERSVGGERVWEKFDYKKPATL